MDLTSIEIFPKGLQEDAGHNLMIGTTEGLVRLNPGTGTMITHRANPLDAGSLSHDFVWALLNDRQGTLWVGTSNGIDKISSLTPKFTLYQAIPDRTATARPENNVTSLAEDKQGTIWFTTIMTPSHQGLFRLERRTNRLTNYYSRTKPASQPNSGGVATNLSNNHITALYSDHGGTLWVATPEGLHAMNTATSQFTLHPTHFTIVDIDEDRQGNLWVGGAGCLARFDPKTGHYTDYCNDPANANTVGGTSINDVLVSQSGAVWVAVGGAGVSKLDPRTGWFTRYHPHYTAREKILFRRDVLAMYETADGAIWVTTNMGGMFRIDPKTEAITTFTTHNGLPDNRIVALTGDDAGMLWMSTHKGLFRLNPVTKEVRIFDEKDGLRSKEFTRTCTRGPNGELVFGCTNGFQVFHPSQLRKNLYIPPVYITKVKELDSVRIFPKESIKLPYQENIISFDFVALNYVASEKINTPINW